MSKLLKRVMEEIIVYCDKQQKNIEQMDFLLIVDGKKRIKIENSFGVLVTIEGLINTKKAISSLIVSDRKEKKPIVGIRLRDNGIWYLETMNTGEKR